jgi:TonB family protein
MMKLLTGILLLLIPGFHGVGQTKSPGRNLPDTIYNIVEKMPLFPGGQPALLKYLGDNIRYPQQSKNQSISGTVYLSFIVSSTGEIKNVSVLRGISNDIDEEAIRVVTAMPEWIPGEHEGRKVDVRYNLPVKFILVPGSETDETVKNRNEGDASYQEGIRAFNEKKYVDAVRYMSEAIRYTCSNDLDALFIRGFAYYNLHDSAAACNDWKICYHRNDPRAVERLQMHCGCFYDPDKKMIYFENAAAERETYQQKKAAEHPSNQSNLIYSRAEPMPRFPGGDAALQEFLRKHIKYPENARQNNISGTVYVTFVIDTAGFISQTRVLKGAAPELDAEALRVISLMPPWESGKKNGLPVNVQFNLPIRFDLKEIPNNDKD